MSPSVKMSSVLQKPCPHCGSENLRLMRERDDAREHADCEKQFADGLKKRIAELEIALYDEQAHCEEFWYELKRAVVERDQARKCAVEMRDLYAAEIDESIAVFPFPWEDEHGADRDGC